ncbi:MAG: MCM DNA helicase complex subunit, partial [Paramarteilia canceri]
LSVHPKLVKSVHYCPATKKTMERNYSDATSLDPFPTNISYPTRDDNGNLLETEYGLSVYKDSQMFSLQELPEKSPLGQLPQSIDVICDDELVDRVKPGDRILVVGSFRCLPGKRNGFTNASFKTIVIANNIKSLSHESTYAFTSDDIGKIKNFVKRKKNVFDSIASSLAPSITGHSIIKKAILCLLVGGTEKLLDNGTRLRGDINLLLLGDPSVAKSQFLRYALNISPRAITTTGRGSSGVGLTAAVTTDPETGDRRLEAGAMVLADRGLVCIDEFDKMLDADKTAIHEVMEQGKVTIAKAGIQAQLNARCSVLAAANPVWGKYDEYKSPMENIGLQDSLLSRFDLVFIILDQADAELDKNISSHVLKMHQYRPSNQQDGQILSLDQNVDHFTTIVDNKEDKSDGLQIYDKFAYGSQSQKNKEILSIEFIRKYLQIAKNISPKLTKSASDMICEEYSKIRMQEKEMSQTLSKTQPITPRALETLIRLATAHAKVRFSTEVKKEDAEFAVEILQYCCFKKIVKKSKSKKNKDGHQEESDIESSSEQEEESEEKGDKVFDYDEEDHRQGPPSKKTKGGAMLLSKQNSVDEILSGATPVTENEFEKAKMHMSAVFSQTGKLSVSVKDYETQLMNSGNLSLSQNQVRQVLERMENDNQVMVCDDQIYLI